MRVEVGKASWGEQNLRRTWKNTKGLDGCRRGGGSSC